jgi:hypothetical protein
MGFKPPVCCGITRRGFLLGAGAGIVGGGAAAVLGERAWRRLEKSIAAPAPKPANGSSAGMPGPYPGRVVEVHHPYALDNDYAIDHRAVTQMVDRGMCDLTGADHLSEAWKRFFGPGDVVGIKVNPVGRSYGRNIPAISSHELVIEVVNGLKIAGVAPKNIILFERYADQFREAGYEKLLTERSMDGVRWFASSAQYSDAQLDIEGYDYNRDSDPHVVGYDPDVFMHMGYANSTPDPRTGRPVHHPRDDRRFRSHLSAIVTRMVNKIINLPVLKDHGSGGVTLALKNLSHGLNNNVARSHLPTKYYREAGPNGPNQCNTFIPQVVAQPHIREKTILHILDGLVAVYQGGPGTTSRCIWPRRSLFFATDPVAMDHIGWEIVDEKRVQMGMPPVAQAGLQFGNGRSGTFAEGCDRRQPEHIILAETIGLGIFDKRKINHRRIDLA